MTPQQIAHVRLRGPIAAVITTRNAVYWTVNAEATSANARYEIVDWDDARGLCVIATRGKIQSGSPDFLTFVNYDIIDELMVVAN